MNRPLAALAAAAMLVASVPTLSFAEDSDDSSSSSSVEASSSSSSSSSSVESSSASSRGNDWKKPCENLTGLLKAQCIVKHNPGASKKKDRVERRNDDKILHRDSRCADKEGVQKVACIRRQEKAVKKLVRKAVQRTIRGKIIESQSSSSSESSED